MSTIDELQTLEEGFWAASGDPSFWQEHFAEGGIIALPMGLMDKDTVVAAQEEAEPWDDFSLENVRLVELDDEAASVSYRATAHREGDDRTYAALISSVYARRNGDWKLMVHHQTPAE